MAPVDMRNCKQFLPMSVTAVAEIDPEGSESYRSRDELTIQRRRNS